MITGVRDTNVNLNPGVTKFVFFFLMIFSSFMYYSFETQRNGLVFIYDMAGSNYTNFELDLSKKILNMLKVS